jgi:two-component sensor histidine kinase
LYIDDDEGLARLVDRGLTRLGFKVIHAADGAEGLDRLQQGGVDAVVLDQYMPGLDGLETLERILAIPNAPPVVFVTAAQDSSIAVTALKAGAADYLVKDVQGDFIPLLQVAVDGALRQAAIQKARDDAEAEVHASRDRYAALAAEREVLLREVNHRVGNSLQIIASLLHLQANSSTEDDVKAALTNAMGRVAAVAQVHRRLYTSHDLKSVLLNQYLDALLEDLRRSAEGNRMSRLTLRSEPIEIDPDRAVAIGIIVNELVMNAVKYAYPDGAGPIDVSLTAQGDDLVLSIADQGVGLTARTDPRSTGMGQRIVTAMASKLDASVERDPGHAGTKIVLRFRRVNKPAAKHPRAKPRLCGGRLAAAAFGLLSCAHDITRLRLFRDHARSAAARLRLRHLPDGRKRRRPDPVLGRAGNARRDPARRL